VPQWSDEVYHAITGHWTKQEKRILCTDKFLDVAIDILSTNPAHFNPRYINVGIAERIALLYEIANVARAQEMYCEAYYNYLMAKQIVYDQYLRQKGVETDEDINVLSWLLRRPQREGWKVFQMYSKFLDGLEFRQVHETIAIFGSARDTAQWIHLAAYAVAVNLENVYKGGISRERLREAAASKYSDPYNLAPWLQVHITAEPTKPPDGQGRRFVEFLKQLKRFVTESHLQRADGGGADKSLPQHSDHLGMVVQAYDQLEESHPGFGIELSKVKLYRSVQDRLDALPYSPEFREVKAFTAKRLSPTFDISGKLLDVYDSQKQIDYGHVLDSEGFPDVQQRDYVLKAWRATLDTRRDDAEDQMPLVDARKLAAASTNAAHAKEKKQLIEIAKDPASPARAMAALRVARDAAARDAYEQVTAEEGGAQSPTQESGRRTPDPVARRDRFGHSSSPGTGLRPVHRATRPLQLQPLYRRFHSSLKF